MTARLSGQQVGASVDLLPVRQLGCQHRQQVGASVDTTGGSFCRSVTCMTARWSGQQVGASVDLLPVCHRGPSSVKKRESSSAKREAFRHIYVGWPNC